MLPLDIQGGTKQAGDVDAEDEVEDNNAIFVAEIPQRRFIEGMSRKEAVNLEEW
ncbi:MAG: hypothetical protein LBB76_05350 [Azoarcus sp.]|nr:hypothetical protein [Azoarcus sp.]